MIQDIFQTLDKRSDVVARDALDLLDAFDVEDGVFADMGAGFIWDDAELGPTFDRGEFNLEPDLELALFGPDVGDDVSRITGDHARLGRVIQGNPSKSGQPVTRDILASKP